MKATVREWVDKATNDSRSAGRELNAGESPNFDLICFLAQQCVEKLAKALLIEHDVVPPKTHDLILLDQLLDAILEDQGWTVEELRFLTRGAVSFRYPGESATNRQAVKAFDLCTRMRSELLAHLE